MTYHTVDCRRCGATFTTDEKPIICCKDQQSAQFNLCDCRGEPLNDYLCDECEVIEQELEYRKNKVKKLLTDK